MLLPVLLAGLAAAAPGRQAVSLDLGLAAELPLSTGVVATLELPGRLRLGAGAGRLPGLLVYSAGEAAASWGLLDDEGASALQDGLGSAWVLAGSLGWRPFPRSGIWLAGDLRRLDLTSHTDLAVIGAAPQVAGATLEVDVHATLVGGSMGCDWVLGHAVTLRLSAGILALRHGETRLEPRAGEVWGPAAERVATDTSRRIDGLLARGLVVPTLGLGLGWHFGRGGPRESPSR